MDSKIKLIRNCNWEEVFLAWYKNEGENQSWIDLAKERGFASWADWRLTNYAKKFNCDEAQWGLYEVSDPALISTWFAGPFRTWIDKYYQGAKTKSFADLATQEEVINNPGVQSMINDYPVDTTLIALELSDGRTFIIEGSHRSCALAIMTKDNKPLPEKLIVAIGKVDLAELPVVGQNTSRS